MPRFLTKAAEVLTEVFRQSYRCFQPKLPRFLAEVFGPMFLYCLMIYIDFYAIIFYFTIVIVFLLWFIVFSLPIVTLVKYYIR